VTASSTPAFLRVSAPNLLETAEVGLKVGKAVIQPIDDSAWNLRFVAHGRDFRRQAIESATDIFKIDSYAMVVSCKP
jgi:hypothetical protein